MKSASVFGTFLLIAGIALPRIAWADFEVSAPDGRRVLLKDDGTWRYAETTGDDKGEAVLMLVRKVERGNNCRFVVQLANNFPYEIRNLVPFYSAYRANGVVHDTVASPSAFTNLRPGDKQTREIEFSGIACPDIVRVQVTGGDRCEMGTLDRFAEVKGVCLSRVRVAESDVVRFDK